MALRTAEPVAAGRRPFLLLRQANANGSDSGKNAMTDAVLRSTEGRIGILTVNNPPVNALAAAVRNGIKEGVEPSARIPASTPSC